MINQEALNRIEELMRQYEYNWGMKPSLDCLPRGLTQGKMVVVMERIVETGESLLVGYDKCFLGK